MAIATASGKANLDFFIEKLNLLDYFDREHIIFDDGSIIGKPDPDLFERAIKKLGVSRESSIIFEDSYPGIQAAMNSKVSTIIIVNSNREDYDEFTFPVIHQFDEFDRNLLKGLN